MGGDDRALDQEVEAGRQPRRVARAGRRGEAREIVALQARLGSRELYARKELEEGWRRRVTPELAAFIAERDAFYLATASAAGQPSLQHRGGPKGFLKVLDDTTLAIADFRGNRQYITAGNLSENDRFTIFLMDYANRQRIKIWGRARVVEDDPELLERLSDPGYRARPERVLLFEIEVWDINCPQHITPRFTEDEIAAAVSGLQQRIVELELENTALRSALDGATGSQSNPKSDRQAAGRD